MRLYIIALQFLTIIPLPFSIRCNEKDPGRSMSFFPLVGVTLGALLVGIDYILAGLLPREVVDLLIVVALAVITGAFHLDGVADVCDGLAARGGRDRFLEVMKDSSTGAVGAVGVVLALLLKYHALLAVPLDVKRDALFCFPILARFTQVQISVGARKARTDGLGHAIINGVGWQQLFIATVTTLALAFFLLGIQGLWLFIAAYIFTWALKMWFHRKVGGITGDIIGFSSELNEILCLLMILALYGDQGTLLTI